MYISKMELNTDITKNYKLLYDLSNDYRVHQMVWNFFADGTKRSRDFLYRIERFKNEQPTIYTMSHRRPVITNEIWSVATKAYEPVIVHGQRLGFILRANPTRKVYDDEGNHFRRDVVLGAKIELERDGIPREEWPSNYEIAYEAGLEWLVGKGEANGFSVIDEDVGIDSYLQRSFRVRAGKPKITFSTIDYSGILTVDDPEKFVDALHSGIGPEKGFGCGMMMVRSA